MALEGVEKGNAAVEKLNVIAEQAAQAVDALELVVAAVASLKSLADAATASNEAAVAAFTSKRDVAVLRERVEVDKRLGVLNLCSMMGALQEVLAAFLASSNDVTAVGAQADEIVKVILGDASSTGKLTFDDGFKQRLARSFFARLCALLAPAHNRIAALFRGAGQCQSGPYSNFLVRDTDATRLKAALVRPRIDVDGSGDDDIYDVQLVSGAPAELKKWTDLGYEQVLDGVSHSPVELNANLCDTERGLKILNSCTPNSAPTERASRRIVILRRRAIRDPNGEDRGCVCRVAFELARPMSILPDRRYFSEDQGEPDSEGSGLGTRLQLRRCAQGTRQRFLSRRAVY